MSSGAQNARARAKQVDYSDFYLPDASAKRSARASDDFSDDDDDVDAPLTLSKLKPVAAKSKSGGGKKKKAKEKDKQKEKSAVGKKTKKRAHASEDDGDDSDEQAAKKKKKKTATAMRDADDAAVPGLKRKAKAPEAKEKIAALKAAKDKKRENESSSVAPKPAKKPLVLTKPGDAQPSKVGSGSADLSDVVALRKKYEALRELRETESERLLQDAKALALEEKKTYERMISKLKKEVSTLSSRLQDDQVKRDKAIEKLEAENKLRLEALERKYSNASDDSHSHRKRIKELEAQLNEARRHSKAAGRADSSRVGSRTAEENIQLAQATKLLEIYRLVTSTDIRLIETAEDDDDDTGYTDVSCTTTDSTTGKQFHFDLGVPGDDDDEIEYLPSETPNKDVKVPSYFQDEMSFTRSEMTKFMRTILDVVIRKKAPDARSGR